MGIAERESCNPLRRKAFQTFSFWKIAQAFVKTAFFQSTRSFQEREKVLESTERKEKSSEIHRFQSRMLELLPRFELGTSSLPIFRGFRLLIIFCKKPSFSSKKVQIANCSQSKKSTDFGQCSQKCSQNGWKKMVWEHYQYFKYFLAAEMLLFFYKYWSQIRGRNSNLSQIRMQRITPFPAALIGGENNALVTFWFVPISRRFYKWRDYSLLIFQWVYFRRCEP